MAQWEDDTGESRWEDVDPPSEPAPKQEPNKIPRLVSAIEGAADAVPGTAMLGTVLSAGRQIVDEGIGTLYGQEPRWSRVIKAWEESKKAQQQRSAKAREDNPWTYGLANFAGAVGTGIATGGATSAALAPRLMADAAPVALTGARAAAQLASGEVVNQLQDANTGRNATPFMDQGVGAIAVAAAKGIIRPVQALGRVLQLPQKAQEEFFSIIGDTKIAKWLADADAAPDGKLLSDRIQNLKQNLNDFEMAKAKIDDPLDPMLGPLTRDTQRATDLAKAATAGRASIAPGNVTMDPAEFGDEMSAMMRKPIDDAADKMAPGMSFYDIPFKESRVVADKMSAQANELEQQAAKFADESAPLEARIPRPVTEADKPAGWDNRYKSTFDVSGPKRVRVPVEQTVDDEARRLEKLADEEMGMDRAWNDRYLGGQDSGILSRPPKSVDGTPEELRKQASDIYGASIRAEKSAAMGQREAWSDTLAQARMIKELTEKQSQVDADNVFEKKRLQGMIDKIQGDLDRINRGRSATQNVIGKVGAATGLYEGYKRGGLVGAGIGYEVGGAAGKRLLGASDKVGAVGQRLAQASAMVDQLAARDDALGRAAKWVLSADGDQFAARLWALTNSPEYQAETGMER